MKTVLKLTEFNSDDLKDSFEIEIRGQEAKDIDTIVKASKTLIETIDVKHVCDEDSELFEDSIKKILLSVADVLVAEGWEIEEETEKAKLEKIVHFINN